MYRLLYSSLSPLRKYPTLSVGNSAKLCDFGVTERTCQLCAQLNVSRMLIRQQSTITSLFENRKKERKKRKKSTKKYVELLIVGDRSSKQQKASVKNLTSNDLKLLTSSSLSLSELYKLRDIPNPKDNKPLVEEYTYSNLSVVEHITSSILPIINELELDVQYPEVPSSENICDSGISTEEAQEITASASDLDLTTIKAVSTFQPEEIEDHHESAVELEEIKETKEKVVKPVVDQKQRDEIFAKILAAYAEVCGVLKNPQRGLNALQFHRGRNRKNDKYFTSMRNIKVYNALLKSFAAYGNLDKMLDVLNIAREEDVDLDVHSYLALFECLGRLNVNNNMLKEIRIFTREAHHRGITYDKIMNQGVFLNNEREIVLRAMKASDPAYTPTYTNPKVQFNNKLLNNLNHPLQTEMPKSDYANNAAGLFTPRKLKHLVDKQLELEKSVHVTIKSIEAKDKPTEDILAYRKTLEEHYALWEESALAAFTRDLSTLTAQRSAMNFEPYMRSIPAKEFVAILVDEAKKMAQGSETYSPTVNMLYKSLGYKVYNRYKVLRKQKTGVLDKICNIHNTYCEDYAALHGQLDVLPHEEVILNPRQKWQWYEHNIINKGATLEMDHKEWTPSTLQDIGKFLYHIVMHDFKVDVNSLRTNSTHKNYLPAFYTIFRTQNRVVKEEVKPHPILSRLYRASVPETLTFPAYEIPMVCPPVPWISTKVGGYLLAPCDFIRLPIHITHQKQRLSEAQPEQIYPSYDALNQLSAVPWMVNERILDVILEVFNSGGSSKLDVPEPPSSLTPPASATPDMDKSKRIQIFRQKLQHRRKKAEMYSLWCDCLYRLSLANHFRKDIFWLPHNMDFRGRVYPIPPHLNHLGSDLARSMLVFAESRPLGPHGLDWLKVHLINLTGLKKRDPVSARLQYANEIMDQILDSADKPLTGQKWWASSDEPWQTLACCMEVAQAIRSPNPEVYRSHFPIHQDGSCNGLQHYAALGRDSAGAYSVNLAPAEVPQDVYSAVVALVEKQREKDAKNGIEIAKTLEGFVKRKVIKQTIMTTVYGVTRFGARLQIAKQLKDIDEFPKESVWAGSSYLTGRTFESLRTMFTSTREIQDWFTDCAKLISSVVGQNVEWVTPLGLPIVQPYFRHKKLNMPSVYDSFPTYQNEKPNVMKQKNAFPPNFIHSLDSSHMMLTSLHCERAGITFVSVHDCYWTHPSTVSIMNKICREQFVALHSQQILEDLSMFLSEKYSYDDNQISRDGSVGDLTKRKLNRMLKKLPKTGNFDINQVLKSVYFFS